MEETGLNGETRSGREMDRSSSTSWGCGLAPAHSDRVSQDSWRGCHLHLPGQPPNLEDGRVGNIGLQFKYIPLCGSEIQRVAVGQPGKEGEGWEVQEEGQGTVFQTEGPVGGEEIGMSAHVLSGRSKRGRW